MDNLIVQFNVLQQEVSTATQEHNDLIVWYLRLDVERQIVKDVHFVMNNF